MHGKFEIEDEVLSEKTNQMKLKAVEDCFNSNSTDNAENSAGYKPNLTLKKPNELQKVKILEDVVQKGTLEDLKAVLSTYKTFEMMARALGLAARYRGVDFVRVLVDHGATFIHKNDQALQRKYKADQITMGGIYHTKYYLMLVFEKLELDIQYNLYKYTPMFGLSYMNISEELEAKALPLKDRLDVVSFISDKENLGVSLDEMLFWALMKGDIDFADALIEMGVNLQKSPPDYYSFQSGVPTYMDIITSGSKSVYWTNYMSHMTKLDADKLFPVLERLNTLAKSAGKKPALTQTFFDELHWNDESLAFALDNINFNKISQKKALEAAVSKNQIVSLAKMADVGWLSQPEKRENLIDFAQANGKTEALAWLMDYKNRTVDVAAEEAKAEAKLMRELTEDPNSVSALKKIWSYKKLDGGTLQITSYKGSDIEVVVPAQIGKSTVSSIGENAFSSNWLKKAANDEVRKKIISVVLPEGLKEIESEAFRGCESLITLLLPSTLKKIGDLAFSGCKALESIKVPKGTKLGQGVFLGCNKLYKYNFLIVNNTLFACSANDDVIEIPYGVTKIDYMGIKRSGDAAPVKIIIPDTVEVIGENAFASSSLESLDIPASVKRIEEKAFYNCRQLKEIHLNEGLTNIGAAAFAQTAIRNIVIPETVTKLGKEVFDSCLYLRDVFIPDSVNRIGERIFGWVGRGAFIHTTEDAYVVNYVKKNYPLITMFYDYEKKSD